VSKSPIKYRILRLINALDIGGQATLSHIDIAEILKEDYDRVDEEVDELCEGEGALLERSGDKYYITRMGRDVLDAATLNPHLIFKNYYSWISEARSGVIQAGPDKGKQSTISRAAIPEGKTEPRQYHNRGGKLAFAAMQHGCTIQEMIEIIMSEKVKLCPKCQRARPADQYHRDNRQADGRHGLCKMCRRR
jgi:hypothetical protein